jgi:rubrerythrin
MTVKDAYNILKTQLLMGKTPKGRVLKEEASKSLDANLADVMNDKNAEVEVVQCSGCGFVVSMLLVVDGCPNCGVVDLTTEITEMDNE